jgi:hypothetical protein
MNSAKDMSPFIAISRKFRHLDVEHNEADHEYFMEWVYDMASACWNPNTAPRSFERANALCQLIQAMDTRAGRIIMTKYPSFAHQMLWKTIELQHEREIRQCPSYDAGVFWRVTRCATAILERSDV